jgi:hypothetical protein
MAECVLIIAAITAAGYVVRVRESPTAQAMTEYVLVTAAIAVAGYVAHEGLEGGINTIIASVTATMKAA